MKPFKYVLLSLVCLSTGVFAQLDTLWTRTIINEGSYIELTGAVALQDGYALCGQAFVGAPFFQDFLVARTDVLGNTVWIDSYGDEQVQTAWEILEADDGTLLTFGTEWDASDAEYQLRISGFSPAGDSLWTVQFPGLDIDGNHGAAKLADGNIVVFADLRVPNSDDRDLWLTKLTPQGVSIWSQTYDLGPFEHGRKVIESADGSLLLAGDVAGDSSIAPSAILMRTTSAGDLLWTQQFFVDDAFSFRATGLAENNSGEIFLSGGSSRVWWIDDAFLIKTEADGDLLWQYDTAGVWGIEYTGVVPDALGGCIVVGTVWPDFGLPVGLLSHFTSTGVLDTTWSLLSWDSGLLGISPAGHGGFLAYGFTGDNTGARNGYLIKLGPSTVVSGRVTHVTDSQPVSGVRVTLLEDGAFDLTDANGDYLVPASVTQTDIAFDHPCITPLLIENVTLNEGEVNEVDATVGIPQYDRQPSSINVAIHYDVPLIESVTLSNDGSGDLGFTVTPQVQIPAYEWLSVSPQAGVIPSGQSLELTLTILADSEQGIDPEFFGSLRVENHSCPDSIDEIPISAIALDADENPAGTVQKFALHPAFPNPFNAETTLRFDLAQTEFVTLNLYDLSGRLVRVLRQDRFPGGSHSLSLRLPDAASGVYFVTLQTASFSETQKIVLIR